jgi:hypothetical protein
VLVAPGGLTAVVEIEQFVEMLDIINPSRLDPSRSGVRQTGHGWIVPGGVEMHLAHGLTSAPMLTMVA